MKIMIVSIMSLIVCTGCFHPSSGGGVNSGVRRIEIVNEGGVLHYVLEGDFVTVPVPNTNTTTTIYKDDGGKLNVITTVP